MASACSSLKRGFSSQPETEVRQLEHQIQATGAVVSDKTLALSLYRKEFPERWEVVKQVKHLLGRKRVPYIRTDIQIGSESPILMVV